MISMNQMRIHVAVQVCNKRVTDIFYSDKRTLISSTYNATLILPRSSLGLFL